MPKKNITKNASFVILALMASLAASGCGWIARNGSAQADPASTAPYEAPVAGGRLESPDLREASGLAASKCQNGVLWTHNDSGDKALLYAIDPKGAHLGVWAVSGAANRDWEDIATVKTDGKCYVLIGDIGDNDHKHERLAVYRIEEPAVAPEARSSSAKEPLTTSPSAVAYTKYPSERHDAEALLAHPASGEVYIVTKSNNSPSHVYKFKPRFDGDEQTLSKVAELTVPAIPNGSVTGGDISPDGTRVVLCDYFSGYELKLPDAAESFDTVWKQRPLRIALGERAIGEAVAYSPDGDFVIAVSEKKNTAVNIARRKAN